MVTGVEVAMAYFSSNLLNHSFRESGESTMGKSSVRSLALMLISSSLSSFTSSTSS